MKVFALHLTPPSSSEACVLGQLLRHLDDDIEVMLAVNHLGVGDPRSHFAGLRRVMVRPVDAGLPLDPQQPRSLASRMLWRLRHLLRRGALTRLAREYRPDLIYTSQQKFDCAAGALAAQALGVPHVVHLHYTPGPWLGRGIIDLLRGCDRVIAISRFIAGLAAAHGVDSARIGVVPNPIEVESAEASAAAFASRPLTIGQVARMAHGKGFDDAARAFALVRREVPEAQLVFVGDGPERTRLERLVRELGLDGCTRFLGWQADVRRLLASFDVFVHASRREPFGLAVLEASAAGLPVVAYDDGAVGEIVVQGQTGMLAAPGDVKGLADALVRLCKDAGMREAMGRAALRRAATAFRPEDAGKTFSRLLRTDPVDARRAGAVSAFAEGA
jgi:glycosyltransferase involved in cell wall biosynthesis